MASFQERENGRVQVKIRKRGKVSSQTFANMRLAQAWAKIEEARTEKLEAGFTDTNPNTFTVGDALLMYFNEHISTTKSAKEYEYVINSFPNYLVSARLRSMTRETVDRYIEELKERELNPATIKKHIRSVLSSAVNYAIRREIALGHVENVFKQAIIPKMLNTAERSRIATPDELKKIVAKSKSKFLQDFINLALETASRRGELVKLKFEDINYEKRTARLWDTKNGTDRDAPLSERAIEILRKRQAEAKNEWVFASPRKVSKTGHILPSVLSKSFREAKKRVEKEMSAGKKTPVFLNLRPHDLRHTAASHYQKSYTIIELMEITGHKDIRSVKRYAHAQSEEVAQKMKTTPPIFTT